MMTQSQTRKQPGESSKDSIGKKVEIKNKILTGLAALVLSTGIADKAKSQELWNYVDNFNNIQQVSNDPYWRSPVFTEPPQYGTVPYLVLSDGLLTFNTGNTVYGDALVYYKLPLHGETDGILSFGLALDVCRAFFYLDPSHLNVAISENGTDWTTLYENNNITIFNYNPFTIRHNLINPMCKNMYLRVKGMRISLDKLDVMVNANNVVPNEKDSWGQIKQLYSEAQK